MPMVGKRSLMFLELKQMSDEDMKKLMGIYAESNRENIAYFYPDCKDESDGLKKVEAGFADLLRLDLPLLDAV